jgi:hypothetical protein
LIDYLQYCLTSDRAIETSKYLIGDRICSPVSLGLPISKALTESMGGAIAIESELGSGSTIMLRFSTATDGSSGIDG